jgi:hypothetical protein
LPLREHAKSVGYVAEFIGGAGCSEQVEAILGDKLDALTCQASRRGISVCCGAAQQLRLQVVEFDLGNRASDEEVMKAFQLLYRGRGG